MEYKTLVRTEHLNPNNCLFGGYMLLWVDEYTYIAAMEEYPTAHFVTRGMDEVVFNQPVAPGSILTFHIEPLRTGTTSVTYQVLVTAMEVPTGVCRQVFKTNVTMCNTTPDGRKTPLPPRIQ